MVFSGFASKSMLTVLLAIAKTALAMSDGPQGHGLIGYGIDMYTPVCATACRDITPKMNIHCPDTHEHEIDESGMIQNGTGTEHDHVKRHDDMEMPPPECLANSLPYLQTIAYCISTHCPSDVDMAMREQWWHYRIVDRLVDPPTPRLSYSQAIMSMSSPPNATIGEQEMLVAPVLVDEDEYLGTYNGNSNFQEAEKVHSRLSIVVISLCALLPILLSLVRFLPVPLDIVAKVRSTYIDAPLISRPVHLPLLGRIAIPTRGQTIFLAYIVLVNVLACSIQYTSAQPNSWFPSERIEIITLVANRTGVISMANLPLLILFAGRNNFLLRLTDWSHSTFLLLHRSVAIMCTLEAVLHSILYLQLYVEKGEHSSESKEEYWIWGIIATLALCLLLLLAIRRIRSIAYEVFLIVHIIGAILVIVGVWYHITYRFQQQWGYDLWVYVASAVWAFDRLCRVLRLVRHGTKWAVAYRIDDDYLRIDVPNIHAEGHVYLYFPTLSWRVWENHPFSVAATNTLPPLPPLDEKIEGSPSPSESELSPARLDARNRGISLLVRNRKGITRRIADRAVPIGSTPTPFRVLVESSYGSQNHISGRALHDYPNVLLIAGGVGITALLPFITAHQHLGSLKLYWETRSQALISATTDLLYPLPSDDGKAWGGCEVKVFVNERMHLAEIISEEIRKGPTLVVVSGPNKMMAEVRKLVAAAGQQGAVVQYAEESFDC